MLIFRNKVILSIIISAGLIFGLTGSPVQAASCDGVTPSSVTVSDASGAYYVVYGVKGAQYVIVRVGRFDDSEVVYYQATHLTGGDWGVSINHDGYGTFIVGFWPNWEFCASATFTRTFVQRYSCYPGSCVPDDNGPSTSATCSDLWCGAPPPPPPPPPSSSITCSPSTIPYNSSATVTWSCSNSSSGAVSPPGWTGTSGSQSTGNLTSSQTYTVTCSP